MQRQATAAPGSVQGARLTTSPSATTFQVVTSRSLHGGGFPLKESRQTPPRSRSPGQVSENPWCVPDERLSDTPRGIESKSDFFSGEAVHLVNPTGGKPGPTGTLGSAYSDPLEGQAWVREQHGGRGAEPATPRPSGGLRPSRPTCVTAGRWPDATAFKSVSCTPFRGLQGLALVRRLTV